MVKICLKDVFPLAKKIAKERQEQKESYESCLKLSENYELVGVLGELLFSLVIGEKMDTELRAAGDDGFDFSRVNIKTSEEYKAKHLIEFVDKKFNGYYYFVVINLQKKYGKILGQIKSSEFRKKAKKVNFGYGDRLAIELDELTPFHVHQKRPLKLKNIYES